MPSVQWFCPADTHPYELYLALSDIRHKRTKVAHPQTNLSCRHDCNGFVERFHRTVLDEFFRTAFRTRLYLSVSDLQADLDAWLHHYNRERAHQGYRNRGKRPLDTINEFLALPDWKERCLTAPIAENVRQEG